MVTTRSQANAKRAATATSPVKQEQKKTKIIILDTPTYTYNVGSTNVKVYNCLGDIIDAYDAYNNQKKTPVVAEKQAQAQPQQQFVRSPIVTRSKSKKLKEEKKVDDWKDEAENCIHNLKHAPTAKDRRSFWVSTIKSLLAETESQKGINCVEHKTILTTQIYKILGYMFNKHFMDFKPYENYWRVVEKKTKELLVDIDEHKKKGKITDETYLLAKKVLQEAQTFQIMYDNLVFPK